MTSSKSLSEVLLYTGTFENLIMEQMVESKLIFFSSNFQFFELIIQSIKALPEIDSITKADNKNQNLILFIWGTAISAAPNIRGTNQFPNPSIKMGMCSCRMTTILRIYLNRKIAFFTPCCQFHHGVFC